MTWIKIPSEKSQRFVCKEIILYLLIYLWRTWIKNLFLLKGNLKSLFEIQIWLSLNPEDMFWFSLQRELGLVEYLDRLRLENSVSKTSHSFTYSLLLRNPSYFFGSSLLIFFLLSSSSWAYYTELLHNFIAILEQTLKINSYWRLGVEYTLLMNIYPL